MNYRLSIPGFFLWLVFPLPFSAQSNPGELNPPIQPLIQSLAGGFYPVDYDCSDLTYRPVYHFDDSVAKGETLVIRSRWRLPGFWQEYIVLIAPPSGEFDSEAPFREGCTLRDPADAPYRVAWIAKPDGSESPWQVVMIQDAFHTVERAPVEATDIRWKYDRLPGNERTLLFGGSNRLGYGESWRMLVYRNGNLAPLKWAQSYVQSSAKNHGRKFNLNAAANDPVVVYPPCEQFARNRAGEISGIAIGIYCLGEIVYDDALAADFYLFPFDSASATFSLNSVVDLPDELPFTMGVIASPYILPRNPFERVAAIAPPMTPEEEDGEIEPASALDAICTEFSGLNNFIYFVGTTSGPANNAETIDPSSIRTFITLNSPCPADQMPEIDAIALGIAQDFTGRWWNSESCRADTLHLPQVDPAHPSACIEEMPEGAQTVMGPYLIISYPACPILKRLVRQYQLSSAKDRLAVRLDGEAIGGATWYGFAPITLVDGEWDSRFLPPPPPGQARLPAGSYHTTNCNPPAAKVPTWPWWRRNAHAH